MIDVQKSVVINRPVAEVFAYMTDPENTPKWQGGVEAVITHGPSDKVGSQYTEVRKFMGQEMKSPLEITAIEANAKWSARVLKGPVPYRSHRHLRTFRAGTKMTTHVEGEPKGFFKVAEGA